MSDFHVQADAIHTAGRSLATDGDDFADQLAAFEEATASYDGAWGDDTIGQYIGTAYAAVAQWALDCWHTIADELSGAGDDLTAMAEAYEQVDGEVAEAFGDIGQTLG